MASGVWAGVTFQRVNPRGRPWTPLILNRRRSSPYLRRHGPDGDRHVRVSLPFHRRTVVIRRGHYSLRPLLRPSWGTGAVREGTFLVSVCVYFPHDRRQPFRGARKRCGAPGGPTRLQRAFALLLYRCCRYRR